MPKYLSGRQKLRPSNKLTEDRYQYLGLDQAEPNLADPLTSPGVPGGTQYQLIAVAGYDGRRYWVPVGGSLQPGAITIFDEGTPVSSASSITQLNFVGAAVTAQVGAQSPSGHPGIAATVTVIPVNVGDNPPNNPTPNTGELWWESDTGDLYVYYNDGDSSQWVMANSGGRGLTGDKGEVGPKGDKGQKGEIGNTGSQGDKGAKGEPSTIAGDKGQKGEVGIGQKGEPSTVKGDKGQKGEVGANGNDGAAGQKGEKGDGSAGGAQVTISDTAPTSPTPANGDLWWESDTFDLHVYYQDGSSNQWVSITSNAALKGEKGDKGQKGEVGDKGQKGEVGTKGDKGEIGATGGTGGTGAKGQKGEIGATGTKGDKGEIGATGGTGGTGSKGQKGEVGATGSAGAAAAKGQKGEVGATGGAGDKGSTGEKGDKGAPSTVAGDKGQKGEVGAQGSGGSTGSTGAKGQKGEVGATGSGGSAGSDGAKGQKGEVGAGGSGGAKGQKGEVGATGSTGSAGSDGSDGAKGQKGEIGTTGDKGQKGEIGAAGAGAPVGQIVSWSGSASSLPSGYFLCDGSAVSRTTYAALYAIVGTTHGNGDGSSTFNIPDLRDRFIIGATNSTGDTTYPGLSPAATGGSADAVVVSHTHNIRTGDSADANDGAIKFEGDTSGYDFPPNGRSGMIFSQGVSGTNKNLPPYYSLAYIIQYAQGGDAAKGQKGEAGTTVSNKPAFRATITGSNVALTNNSHEVIPYNNEEFDTDNCFNTSSHRFTPNVAGYYYVSASVTPQHQGSDALVKAILTMFKNSTEIASCDDDPGDNNNGDRMLTQTASAIVQMNGSSDYLECKVFSSVTSGSTFLYTSETSHYFQAYKLII